MVKESVTSLGLRKLTVKLCIEDKLSIGDISKSVWISKSFIHGVLRKIQETGSCEAKKPPGRPRKTTEMEDRWIGKESKRIDLRQKPLYQKELMLNLALKYQGTLFPEHFMKYI